MKKTFVLLLFSLSTSLSFSQLPKGLMGIEVGFNQVQVDSVISMYQKVKLETDKYGTIEVSGKLIFEDIKWNTLRIRMYGGKVTEVQLEKKSKMSTLSREAEDIMKTYNKRYENYYDDWTTKESYCLESILKFNNQKNIEIRISYYMCSGGSLYLTCSHYYNYRK